LRIGRIEPHYQAIGENDMHAQPTQNDQRCIWMNAGVISYKLCDQEFNCDYCPLDIVLRKTTQHGPGTEPPQVRRSVDIDLPSDLPDEVAHLLHPFTAMHVAADVQYSPEHLWVRSFNRKLSLVGLDSFLAALLPASASIVLSAQHTHVERGRPLGWVYANRKAFPIPSPMSGTVLRHNRLLDDDLTLIKENNLDLGWLVTLLPSDYDNEHEMLLDSNVMHDRIRDDMRVFVQRAIARFRLAAGPEGLCLNDGGAPVSSLENALGAEAFHQLIRPFFPSSAE
jgi:glycine cleavage system H lipoate-binding protein